MVRTFYETVRRPLDESPVLYAFSFEVRLWGPSSAFVAGRGYEYEDFGVCKIGYSGDYFVDGDSRESGLFCRHLFLLDKALRPHSRVRVGCRHHNVYFGVPFAQQLPEKETLAEALVFYCGVCYSYFA